MRDLSNGLAALYKRASEGYTPSHNYSNRLLTTASALVRDPSRSRRSSSSRRLHGSLPDQDLASTPSQIRMVVAHGIRATGDIEICEKAEDNEILNIEG